MALMTMTSNPPRRRADRARQGADTLRYEVRALNLITVPGSVRARLRLEENDDVLYVERLRMVGGVPVSLEAGYLVLDVARGVVGGDLTRGDLVALVEETTGRRLGRADLLVEATGADAQAAAALGTTKGSPLLLLERVTHLDDATPIALECIHFRGDRTSLRGLTHRELSIETAR
jgi:GntR family transcriptional regulator